MTEMKTLGGYEIVDAAARERISQLENNGGNTGEPGADGATFIPSVSEDGIISWTNDKNLENPEPVNIKGGKGDYGNGIDYIQDMSGVLDGYTTLDIYFTDGTSQTVNIPNGAKGNDGRGIVAIKSTTSGTDENGRPFTEYTIEYTDDTQSTFIVTDGKDGTSGGGSSVEVLQTTGESTTAVMSQKATTEALANLVREAVSEAQAAEMRNYIVSSGTIMWGNDRLSGFILNVENNATYKITVSGVHNRFIVSGSMEDDPKTGTSATTIWNSGNSTERTNTESTTITNTAGYKHLIVTIAYQPSALTGVVTYQKKIDGTISVGGHIVYTAEKVDELIATVRALIEAL